MDFQSQDNQSIGTLKSNENSVKQNGELSEEARNEKIRKLLKKQIEKKRQDPPISSISAAERLTSYMDDCAYFNKCHLERTLKMQQHSRKLDRMLRTPAVPLGNHGL